MRSHRASEEPRGAGCEEGANLCSPDPHSHSLRLQELEPEQGHRLLFYSCLWRGNNCSPLGDTDPNPRGRPHLP